MLRRIFQAKLPPDGRTWSASYGSQNCNDTLLMHASAAAVAAADCAQVAADLPAAAAAVAAHPSKLLLPGSTQLTYAEISLATALNKTADLNKPLAPAASSSAAAAKTSTSKGAGADAASTGDAASGSTAAPQTMADCMPLSKQLLQQFPELLQWAQDTAQQHWAAGASMPAS